MWALKPNTFLIVLLVGASLVIPAECGVKQFVKDTYKKVKSVFQCDSHETDDDHLNAIEKAGGTTNNVGTTSTTTKVGIVREEATVNTIEGLNIEEIFNIPSTTPYPEIDLRIGDGTGTGTDGQNPDAETVVIGNRILVDVPRKDCPNGFRHAHGNRCREVV